MRHAWWLWGLALCGPGQTIAQESAPIEIGSAQAQLQTRQDQLERFGELLQDVRSGEDEQAEDLRRIALRLAEQGRTDAMEVAEFYLGLSSDARRSGLEAEAQFFALRDQVRDAEELRGEDWSAVRWEIQIDLLELIQEQNAAPDPTPAARAYALLARLAVSQLDRDGSLNSDLAQSIADKAQQYAQDAIERFEQARQRTPQLEPIWLLGEVNRLCGRSADARAHYMKMERLADFTGRLDYKILALRGLVCLARESGDTLGVGRWLRKWAALQTPQASWELAREQALWLLSEEEPQAALTFLWNCKPERADQTLQWEALACSALRRRGHLSAARSTLESMRTEHGEELELLPLTEALQLQAEGSLAQAEDLLQALEPFDGWSARGRVQAWTLLGDLRLAQGQASRALAPLRRALREAQGWESRRLGPGSVSGEWLGLHAIVLAAQAASESGDALMAATLLEANQARHLGHALNRDLGARSGPASLRHRLETDREVGAGVVSFGFGSEFGLAVHLGPAGKSHTHRIAVTRRELQLGVLRLREAIMDGNGPRAHTLAAELSALLAPCIGEWARPNGGAPMPLRLLLHGPLEELPISMLTWDRIPIDECLDWIANTSLWSSMDPSAPPADWRSLTWHFFGAPGGSSYPALPAAIAELKALALSHPGSSLCSGAELDAEALRTALTGQDAVHLATHLVLSPTCEDPELLGHGLLLGEDQVLCASTVRDWAPGLPLVFLGACASGSGLRVDGEGQLGLARALQAGGTRNLIVTLWPVSDRGSAEFGKAFHAAMARGLAPSQATAQARQFLRAYGYPMRDWAAFMHLGLD